jgi:RecB family exonuclease
LIIRGGEFPIRIRGRIDRLDRRHDGWVIIDYKTGSSPGTKADFEEGSDLQLPIYTIAVNELFSLDHAQAVDGFYYVLRYFRRSGRLAKNLAELCDKAKEHAMAHVAKISAGRFPPTPRDDSTCGSCPACGICAYSESRAERKSPDEDGPD